MSDRAFTAHLQGVAVGLSGGYAAAWWSDGLLMYGVAVLAIALMTVGYALDRKHRAEGNA